MNSCWPCALASARVTVSIRRPSSRAARLRCLWHSRHDAVRADRDAPAAGRARAVGAVFLPPGFAGHAHPPVAGGDAPRQAVRAGGDFDRAAAQFPRRFPSRGFRAGRMMVAAGAQSRGVIVLPRPAAAARRRGNRAAGPAFETARDFPHRRRPDPAGLAEILMTPLMPGAPICAGPAAAPDPAWCPVAAAGGLRAATLSGSQTIRSAGVHSSTAQITSRSSSRIDTGVVVHQRDIFPALISSPASASRRRISVDFQMPRSAAVIRRFQRMNSPRSLTEPGGGTVISVRPRPLDMVGVDMNIAGRGGQPFVPEQFLDRFQVHAAGIQRRRAEMPQRMRRQSSRPVRQRPLDRVGQPVAQRLVLDPAAPAGVLGSRRSDGSSGASGSFQSSPNWCRTSVIHQSSRSPAWLIAGISRVFGAPAVAAFAEPDVDLAELAQVPAPVPDVEHVGLLDPQPGPPPQRRGQVIPRRGQELPAPTAATPATRRTAPPPRRPDGGMRRAPVVGPRGPVVLIDHLLDDVAGQRMDVALISGRPGSRRNAPAPTPCSARSARARPSVLALVGQEPVSVVRAGRSTPGGL